MGESTTTTNPSRCSQIWWHRLYQSSRDARHSVDVLDWKDKEKEKEVCFVVRSAQKLILTAGTGTYFSPFPQKLHEIIYEAQHIFQYHYRPASTREEFPGIGLFHACTHA